MRPDLQQKARRAAGVQRGAGLFAWGSRTAGGLQWSPRPSGGGPSPLPNQSSLLPTLHQSPPLSPSPHPPPKQLKQEWDIHTSLLAHPNVIQPYLAVEDDAAVGLFMEYAGEGGGADGFDPCNPGGIPAHHPPLGVGGLRWGCSVD